MDQMKQLHFPFIKRHRVVRLMPSRRAAFVWLLFSSWRTFPTTYWMI